MKDAIREIISNNWRYFKDPITITEIGQQLASASRLTVDLGEVRVVLDQLKSDGVISEVKPGAFVPLCAKTTSGGIVMKSLLCAALCFSSLLIATAATVSDVTARQRYPWNGLVDLHFTITGDAGTKYDTSFTAKDMVGNTNIAMRTIRKADGTAAAAKEQLLPGTYSWVWDATADLPDGFQCERVTVTGTADVSAFPYSVKFNANGGTGSMANESFIYGMEKALTANAFTRTGYTFQGWATSANGAKVYNDKQSVSNLTETSGTVVNLYAVWKSALYMVVDLSSGGVNYRDSVPSGGWGDSYRKTLVTMRLCSPGEFLMQGKKKVHITKPFYIGVFEMTEKQIWAIAGTFYAGTLRDKTSEASAGMNACGCISYNTLRGKNSGAKWPLSNAVDSSSLIGKIRSKTGMSFDVPTEAQWEYACRAGTTTSYNNGSSSTGNLSQIAYYKDVWNSSIDFPAVVGKRTPNAWGLYDMHGNASEWVLDWYGTIDTSEASDPQGPSTGSKRICRGGLYSSAASACTSNSRSSVAVDLGTYSAPDYTYDACGQGFRLCLTLQ